MQYPLWEVPILGGGMVIAIIAIVHVMVAHFAVGAGLFVAVTEYRAIRYGRPLLRRFLKDFSFFLVLVSFVFGALTGVGIWFSIALVSPAATSALIHQYVWGWATEWVFFIIEILAGYIYYYTWDRLDEKKHLLVGCIYAFAAFMSLVIINGILSFMLTPGTWVQTKSFWDGFFNPTFWPSTILRTISALSLAAIYVIIAVNLAKDYTKEERHEIIREAGLWLMPLILMIPVSLWYFTGVSAPAKDLVTGQSIAMMMFFMIGAAASTIIGFYGYFGLILNKRNTNLETAFMLLMIAFLATGSMEFVREGIRKPFIIYNYMYSNGILVDEVAKLNQDGVLGWAPWTALAQGYKPEALPPEKRGQALFRAQCMQCHTYNGANGIMPLIKNWPADSIHHAIENLHTEHYYMPPFVGPGKDMNSLTEHLFALGNKKAAPQPAGKDGK